MRTIKVKEAEFQMDDHMGLELILTIDQYELGDLLLEEGILPRKIIKRIIIKEAQ